MYTRLLSQGRRSHRIIGDIKENRGSPRSFSFFCETTHNICIKIQQTTVAVTLTDILNNITSKILGVHYHGCPPFINIGGTCPPCPIGIDTPDRKLILRQSYDSLMINHKKFCKSGPWIVKFLWSRILHCKTSGVVFGTVLFTNRVHSLPSYVTNPHVYNSWKEAEDVSKGRVCNVIQCSMNLYSA